MGFPHKLLIFAFLFFQTCNLYAEISSYPDTLIEKAITEKAYLERQWEILLHYEKNIFQKNRSLVDDPKFFLSEKGKTDPSAEIEATLRGFFAPVGDSPDEHPYCRFPARRQWLVERLGIDESKFPKIVCTEFEKRKKEIDPKSITLIFPFLYISKPVSMFGHTLLRINNSYNDPLLAHGVTYSAAMPDDVNLLDYSFRGLMGGYPGLFMVKKYYETIYEYTNIDKRDIWEYDLNFTEEETNRLFNHLWEMANVYSDYYFMDENCSYNLMFLLEAGRPTLQLTTSTLWEAPSETVKRLYKLGITGKVRYRPSHSNTMESIAASLPNNALNMGLSVGRGEIPAKTITESSFEDKVKAGILDLAIEILRYDNMGKAADIETVENYRKKTLEFLTARSKYRLKNDYHIEKPTPPHEGHDITSISMAAGFSNGDFYIEPSLRLGFHSLYDIDDGYIKNSDTTVADIALRYNTSTGDIKVQKVVLLSIASYVPLGKLFQPFSWKLNIGGVNKDFKNDGERFVPYLGGGAGLTFKIFDEIYMWITADIDLSFSKGYSSYAGLGLGGSAGVSYDFAYGKIMGEGYYRNYVISGLKSESGVSAKYIFPVSRNNTATAEFIRKESFGVYKTEVSLSWRFYF